MKKFNNILILEFLHGYKVGDVFQVDRYIRYKVIKVYKKNWWNKFLHRIGIKVKVSGAKLKRI